MRFDLGDISFGGWFCLREPLNLLLEDLSSEVEASTPSIAFVEAERGGFSTLFEELIVEVSGLFRESPAARSFFSVIDGFFPGLFI